MREFIFHLRKLINSNLTRFEINNNEYNSLGRLRKTLYNMEKYIGIKEVNAQKMNEYDAVERRFARINEDNHEWREGYHVQYVNPNGSIYDSWSPKDVFEKSYQVADTPLDRMRIEYNELMDKHNKLVLFFSRKDAIEIVGVDQASLMDLQKNQMHDYLITLRKRIDLMK